MMLSRWLAVTTAGLCLAATCAMAAESALVGTQSCATVTCHGGIADRGVPWNSSYSVWQSQDPHAWAGLSLLSDTSQRIVAALNRRIPRIAGQADDGRADDLAAGFARADPTTVEYQVLLANRCVSCHVTTDASELASLANIVPAFLARGVACESCHGPASEWLVPHVYESWKQPSRGMRNTSHWLITIDGCSRCHVGSRTEDGLVRDVNHDLVAAGHPAMRFDPSLFASNLPVHWKPTPPTPHLLTRFESGRWQTLAAAARLAEERLSDHLRAPQETPWPELAEYDCFACHHDLMPNGYRGDTSRLGSPDWNPWYLADISPEWRTVSMLALPRVTLTDYRTQVDPLREIQSRARQRAQSAWAKDETLAAAMARTMAQLRNDSSTSDWHDAAAWYLRANAALRGGATSQMIPPDHARTIKTRLHGFATDVLFFGNDFTSPRHFDPDVCRKYRQIITQLFPDK